MENSFTLRFCDPDISRQLLLIHYGSSYFKDVAFTKITNSTSPRAQKPNGGLWTAPVNGEADPWKGFCTTDLPSRSKILSNFFYLKFKETAKVALIDCYEDLESLPMLGTPEKEFDTNVNWGLIGNFADAIWLTKNGASKTRLTLPYNLTLWDCECVLIFNPNQCYQL